MKHASHVSSKKAKMKDIHQKKGTQPVHLPKVPVQSKPINQQDEFWLQQGASGAINAFRQLSHSTHKGGRKHYSLPGGKLKPLFKDNTGPAKTEGYGFHGSKYALPTIQSEEASVMSNPVLTGTLNDLPPLVASSVRIYICSNYKDMKAERNVLMSSALPQLEDYCSQLGLHLQVVDLHWGVEWDSAALMGTTRNLRSQEIADCQRLSLGPNFVLLLGDSYGLPQVPQALENSQYTALQTAAGRHGGQAMVDMLEQHYVQEGEVYHLKVPVATEKQNETLARSMWDVACFAVANDLLDEKTVHRLFVSVLEEDITKGVFEMHDPRNHCLSYRREFQQINRESESSMAAAFLDVSVGDGDIQRVEELLYSRSRHMSDKVMQHLGIGNCHQYFLKWDEDAYSSSDEREGEETNKSEFQAYLDQLSLDLVKDLKHSIDRAHQGILSNKKKTERLVNQEVVFHATLCKQKLTGVQGLEKLLFKVEKFLRDPRQNFKLFVIHGEGGCGKTTAMAALTKSMKEWFSDDCVVVSRFLGTTTQSCAIRDTVVSITLQICLAYGLEVPDVKEHFRTLFQCLTTFRNVLDEVAKEHAFAHPLFILLDGIDNLLPHEEALKALWAIKDFPPNVHMIVSTTPQVGQVSLLGALLTMVTTEDATAEVEALDVAALKKVVEETLPGVNQNQTEVILSSLGENPNMLYVDLLLRELKAGAISDLSDMPKTVQDIVGSKLTSLEGKYGLNVVKYFAAYITASKVGVHERELLELLTGNPDVMQDVHSRYLPLASSRVFLFPPAILARLKHELQAWLAECHCYGKSTLAWRHVEISTAASALYHLIYPGIDPSLITDEATNFTLMLHEHFSNVYLPEARTEFLGESTWTSMQKHTEVCMAPLRQPLIPANLTKLQKLPAHMAILLPIEGLARTRSHMVFDYNWLHTKLQATGVDVIIHDVCTVYDLVIQLVQEGVLVSEEHLPELSILLEFFQLAEPALMINPNHLAPQVIARLAPLAATNDYPALKDLTQKAEAWLRDQQQTTLIPVKSCLAPPKGPLRHSLAGPTHVVGFLPGGRVAVTFSCNMGIGIWQLDTGEQLQRYPVNREQSVSGIIPGHARQMVLIGHYSHLNHLMDIGVWSSETGVRIAHATFQQKFEVIALDPEDKILMVATTLDSAKQADAQTRCLWGVDVHTKDIVFTLAVLNLHQDGITQVIFLHSNRVDAKKLITIGNRMSKDLGVWNLIGEQLEHKVDLGVFVDRVEVHHETELAVCGNTTDGVLVAVDLSEGRVKQTIHSNAYSPMSDFLITEAGQHVVIATKRAGIIIVSLESGKETKRITEGYAGEGMTTTFRVPTKLLLWKDIFLFVGHIDGSIVLYSIAWEQSVWSVDGHAGAVNTLHQVPHSADAPDTANYMLSAADDQTAKMWNMDLILSSISEEMKQVTTSDFLQQCDGRRQFEEQLPKHSAGETEVTQEMNSPCDKEDVSCMVMTKDWVITGSNTGPIKVWSLDTGKQEKVIDTNCEHGVTDMYLAYKGRLLVGHCVLPSVPMSRALQLWNTESWDLVSLENAESLQVYTSSLFPGEDKILAISPSKTNRQQGIMLNMLDLLEMKCVASLHCNIYGNMDCTNLKLLGFTSPALTPNDLEVISVSNHSRENSLVESKKEESVQGEQSHPKLYAILDYFPQPNVSFFFTFVIHGAALDVIEMDHHEPIHLDTQEPSCAVALPGCECVTGTADGALLLWDVTTQSVICNLHDEALYKAMQKSGKAGQLQNQLSGMPAHEGAVMCVAAENSGQYVATGGLDGKIRLWNVPLRRLLRVLSGHSKPILALSSWSLNGYLASGSLDNSIVLWDCASGEPLSSFYTHDMVTGIALTPTVGSVVGLVGSRRRQLAILQVNQGPGDAPTQLQQNLQLQQ